MAADRYYRTGIPVRSRGDYQKSKNTKKQKIPKEGDLVVVRNHAVDSQKGRKLESRWLGPRILVSYTASGLSAYIRKLHGSGKTKRYHLNDLLLYNPRSAFKINDTTILQTSHGKVPTVIGGRGGGEPGSRAVFLSSRGWWERRREIIEGWQRDDIRGWQMDYRHKARQRAEKADTRSSMTN